MGRHSSIRNWLQLLPPLAIGGLVLLGGYSAMYATRSPQAAPAARASSFKANPVGGFRKPRGGVTGPVTAVPLTYTTIPGDSWWKIAARYCHSPGDILPLMTANHLGTTLPLGKVIIIHC